MARHFILMGDIVRSSSYDARNLRHEFMQLISSCNRSLKDEILSPYTVTLGDEFQGVARSLQGLINAVFYLEEACLQKNLKFKMRFVGLYGEIETPVNKMKAHGMLGDGLTSARELLTDKHQGKPRFQFVLPDVQAAKKLNRLFFVIDGLITRWNPDDGRLILDMITDTDNVEVGKMHGKNRTQIWKRRKNLLIEEYRTLKEVILDINK